MPKEPSGFVWHRATVCEAEMRARVAAEGGGGGGIGLFPKGSDAFASDVRGRSSHGARGVWTESGRRLA